MKLVQRMFITAMVCGLLFGYRAADDARPNARKIRTEPDTAQLARVNGSPGIIHTYDRTNGLNVTLVDSSKNGYGLIEGGTRPISVTDEGWIVAYRQWAGENGSSGQIGAAFSTNGADWTTYTNLNPGLGSARFPSAVGTPDYPYIFWNERSPENGRPYYIYDEFGWDGGSFSTPIDVDLLWNAEKDRWVGSPVYNYDSSNDLMFFNIALKDWTDENGYVFHSEAYDDGFIIFGEELLVINVAADLEAGDGTSTYSSSAVMDINDDGIGYVAMSAFFLGANQDPPDSDIANAHTVVLKQTENFGASWTGGQLGTNYFFIPDEVFQHMMDTGAYPPVYHDECDGDDHSEDLIFESPFCTYDLDIKVDSDGNPHIIVGILGSIGEFVYPGIPDNGFFHFWIDKDYLTEPGEPMTATGWNYSKIMPAGQMWRWETADGDSYWQNTFPSFTISEENEDIMYVVIAGPDPGDFVVTDDGGTPDDECDDLGLFPEWNQEVFVVKSEDGGETWWCPYNATKTVPDCWVDEESGEYNCADDEICSDGETLDEPSEISAHTGIGATNSIVPIIYQRPDWCFGSTTGDMAGMEHKNRLYMGWVELTDEECIDECDVRGDANCDGTLDILDIISILNHLLYGNELCQSLECIDFNLDLSLDILDIVAIVNYILYGPSRTHYASEVQISTADFTLSAVSDGVVGALQIDLIHEPGFSLDVTESALVHGARIDETHTTLIIVGVESGELFTANQEFTIENTIAASGDGYINVEISDNYNLLSSYPNPFNPVTTIHYSTSADGPVEITIFNVLGQPVAHLVSEFRHAGTYQVQWSGLDDNQSPVSSGVYLVRLQTQMENTYSKITLMR